MQRRRRFGWNEKRKKKDSAPTPPTNKKNLPINILSLNQSPLSLLTSAPLLFPCSLLLFHPQPDHHHIKLLQAEDLIALELFYQGMGLWTLLEGLLLLANGLAILNEDRLLAPRGWSFPEVSAGGRAKSVKGQLIGLIYATQYLRVPLIALNMVVVIVKLVSG